MARQFVNTQNAETIKAKIASMGGEVSFRALRDALIEDGNGDMVRDVTNLHISGVIPGIVRAVPDSKPELFLRSTPYVPPVEQPASGTTSGASGNVVPSNPTGNTQPTNPTGQGV